MTEDAVILQKAVRDDILTQVGRLLQLGKLESFEEQHLTEETKYIFDVAFNEGSPATMRITINVDPDE